MWPCCFFLRRSIFSLFSFLPHIFLVIDYQWSFSKNRGGNFNVLSIFVVKFSKPVKTSPTFVAKIVNFLSRRGAKEWSFAGSVVLTCTSIWGKKGKLMKVEYLEKKEERLRDSRNRLTKRSFGSSYSYFRAACLLHHPGAAPRVTGVIFWISVVPTSAGRAACTCALSFRDSPRHSCCGLIASFPGHRVLRPEDACPKRFSWFFYWIPKVQ